MAKKAPAKKKVAPKKVKRTTAELRAELAKTRKKPPPEYRPGGKLSPAVFEVDSVCHQIRLASSAGKLSREEEMGIAEILVETADMLFGNHEFSLLAKKFFPELHGGEDAMKELCGDEPE